MMMVKMRESGEEAEEEDIPREMRDWHELANRRRTQFIQYSRLGKRDLDRDFDWYHNYTTFEDISASGGFEVVQHKSPFVSE